ncbi:MAG: phage major capsid protein [Clostridiales Family XIII bacterium]|uniref:phage major capsid protein n=1 Tax=Hominibacterium faecale TaxID=2839743 RepID=UPI0022B29F00|nr:phage major capsid protein [Hominibacterium faecale]MCI7301840.1 phage major capsid protein [Clostridia bacterium]MDY3010317.1 phage major capsid protein [Clostridiales Family XIII bacterium]
MALKVLLLRKKLEAKNAELKVQREKEKELKTRETELEKAIDEIREDTPAEDQEAVEKSAEELEQEKEALKTAIRALEDDIKEIEEAIKAEEEKEPTADPAGDTGDGSDGEARSHEGGEGRSMKKFFGMSRQERAAFFANEEVKTFLERLREIGKEKRAVSGSELIIPELMLDLIKENVEKYSKLISKVRMRPVPGKARQNIMGKIPEAVWTEACGTLNELDFLFGQVEVDGYKVGGFVPICNATLEDNDVNLAQEVIAGIGQAIGIAIDKAILYGSGVKMPMGIATRLAQTVKPADYPDKAPEWEDLHSTNIKKMDAALNGAEFYSRLILHTAATNSDYATGEKFWAMNELTYATILSKSVTVNMAGTFVASVNGTLPLINGEIVILNFMDDGDIVGGYGQCYFLAERAGTSVAVSDQYKFVEDQTVFKGTARYDGMPVIADAFIVINIENVDAATIADFKPDRANEEIELLAIASAAGTNAGTTKITVTPEVEAGNTYKYKVLNAPERVRNGERIRKGWTGWDGISDIEAEPGTVITVVELDGGEAVKVGSTSVAVKE